MGFKNAVVQTQYFCL